MSQLDLVNDALHTFLDADNGFAESIEYWPAGAVAARQIKAIVDRNPPAPIGEAPRMLVTRLQIEVANDGTAGILATELDRGSDRVKLALRVGGTAEFRVVAAILKQDAGMLTLEVH